MNKYLLAIDPSLRSTGVALFLNRELIACDFFKTPTKLKRYDAMLYSCRKVTEFMADNCNGYDSVHCVIEEQIRRGEDDRMSMDDFIRLASLSYMIIPTYLRENVTFVLPSTWKKGVEEGIMATRVYQRELSIGTKFKLIADVQVDRMHAIGIGRWYYANHK